MAAIKLQVFWGIDPGKKGGIAYLTEKGKHGFFSFEKLSTDSHEFKNLITYLKASKSIVVMESVRSSPQQGVTSAFNFGRNAGFYDGMLKTLGITPIEIAPAKWQGALGCRSKGNKNVTKDKAKQIFKDIKITHENADALLIAYYNYLKNIEV